MAQGQQVIEVGIQALNQLIAQSVALIRESGVLSELAWQQALLCPDGQIHEAASRHALSERDRQLLSTVHHDPVRPKRKVCGVVIAIPQAVPRSANEPPLKTGQPVLSGTRLTIRMTRKMGKASMAIAVCRCNWLIHSAVSVSPCWMICDQPISVKKYLPALCCCSWMRTIPTCNVDAVAGDAGYGYDVFLHTVYDHLRARRVVNLRHHQTDQNQENWVLRGYDDGGRPICPYGYSLTSNGFDYSRQRSKWTCQKACLKNADPKVQLPQVSYPPTDCPYQDTSHGRIVNLAERFPDGSLRLARDVPVGGPSWKLLYHRARNAVEGRNAIFEAWGLKRLPVYGLPRVTAFIFLADVLNNLTTLARLIREATLANQDP